MRRKHLLAIGVLSVLLGFSLVVSVEAASMWSRTYPGTGIAVAYSLLATSDGGYVIMGTTGQAAQLIKTDSAGNMQWSQTYGGWFIDNVYSLVQTVDGGYAVAGCTYSHSANAIYEDAWLFKTDASGNLQWEKVYGDVSYDGFYSLIRTSDDGYVLAGYTTPIGAASPPWTATWDLWLVKTDAYGNMEWNKTYDFGGNDFARSVVATADGGYALAGSGLFKTDAHGNMEWNKTYGALNSWAAVSDAPLGSFASLVVTADGGFAGCGGVGDGGTNMDGVESSDCWLVKTDPFGNLLWNKTYGGTNTDFAHSLIVTPDGGYALAGTRNCTYYSLIGYPQYDYFCGDAWLIKTDAFGNMLWNQTYGGEGIDEAHALVACSDGGYALVGSKGVSSNQVYCDYWLIKTDEFGVVPEFPTWITLPALMSLTLLSTAVLKKRKRI